MKSVFVNLDRLSTTSLSPQSLPPLIIFVDLYVAFNGYNGVQTISSTKSDRFEDVHQNLCSLHIYLVSYLKSKLTDTKMQPN